MDELGSPYTKGPFCVHCGVMKWKYEVIDYGDSKNQGVWTGLVWQHTDMEGMAVIEGLNHLGGDGWELVAVVPLADSDRLRTAMRYFFKK